MRKSDLNKIYLFRMTHIENMPHILKNGITHITSSNRNQKYVPIADAGLINTRHRFEMPNGEKLGDYIPFYFGYRMPMLYVIQKGFNGVKLTSPEKIVYCVSSVQKMIDTGLDFVFTDGHAIDALSSFYSKKEVGIVHNILDFEAISALYWNEELDLKRRKEAEFLVANDIPLSALLGYVVYNETAKTQLTDLGIPTEKIAVRPNYYF